MVEFAQYLVTGLFFGLVAGISPGPLFTLVISETIQGGPGAGIKVALSPLVSDIPIVGATVLILIPLSQSDQLFGIISLCGALFLGYLAIDSFKGSEPSLGCDYKENRALQKGVLANALNPNPYLFGLLWECRQLLEHGLRAQG